MSNQRLFTKFVCGLSLVAAGLVGVAMAADKDPPKTEGKVAGLLIDKKDNWITVKTDGEDDPVLMYPLAPPAV